MQEYLEDLIAKRKVRILTDEDAIRTARKFLHHAYKYAQKNSDDESTWTAAIAVKGNKIISEGANKFSPGVEITKKRTTRPLKYQCLDHAERQCIYNAAREGIALETATMYSPWIPCIPCANSVISSGFVEIIMHYEKVIKTPADWLTSDLSVSEAMDMLIESSVTLSFYKGKIGGIEHLYRGAIWKP